MGWGGKMLFNSFQYILFLPIIVGLYYCLRRQWQSALLLVASLYFYMAWRFEYVLVVIASAMLAWGGGWAIQRARSERGRTLALTISVSACVALLAVFKYAAFAATNLNLLLGLADQPMVPVPDILLPVGISFHTFQAIAYCVDIHRRDAAPSGFRSVLMYIAFFPQSVAGPIERPTALIPQMESTHTASHRDVVEGLQLILWGAIKKVVIADRLAIYVDQVYAHPEQHHGLAVLTAFYFFAFQIYCDFSGYTDMARGSARLFGIDLVTNFRRPYMATSLAEFWHRWHMSLSQWFRDYVYIPLGGNRGSAGRWSRNVMATFVLSGLWHGAAWTYVVWGALHGGLMVLARWLPSPKALPGLGGFLGWLVTFHTVVVAWIFFRANSMADAVTLMGNALLPSTPLVFDGGLARTQLALGMFSIVFLVACEVLAERHAIGRKVAAWPRPLRWGLYYAGIFAVLLVPGAEESKAFIYFQF